ncbi:putative RNA polymerase sigma subunit [Bradyrhizobium sp. ORS 278]|uniref:sigma-70 family RNA polymerase sigma factor n=1 Tax=Bradyrhizobium sp. (strain ORS 278) TaxID=114615 RepID=UPI0001507F46|nr:sigma-70 family RNA polymerase sigma factor [Bradyrhizobium sp. ORS 278]CAL78082.1 putative RNA polymerase sigma subunit [Bradyrhizobium sp. ORS 278]
MSDGPDDQQGTRKAELVAELAVLAEQLRPELHRYCARLMGSVIDGEDVVQDTLTRALTTLDEMKDIGSLRAWLFKVAHNRALDLLRGRAIRAAEPMEAADDIADVSAPDAAETMMRKEAIRTAVSRFTELPIPQRSILILKDVLDEPLADIAALLGLTVDSVKAHLARARARLSEINAVAEARPAARPVSEAVARYVSLFNQRDWDGLRALLADDVKLHQSTHPVRVGSADVGLFFSIYAGVEGVWLAPAWLEGREVIAVFDRKDDRQPSYVMWLSWRDGKISFIRDYRYVRYVIADAELVIPLSS